MALYHGLDIAFLLFHSLLILFNLLGWLWRATRRWNLVTLLLTAGSWVLLGVFYGWGYCPLTDWHWNILHRLGHTQLPASYIEYLLERLTPWHFSSQRVDIATVAGLVLALIASVYTNFFYQGHRKAGKASNS